MKTKVAKATTETEKKRPPYIMVELDDKHNALLEKLAQRRAEHIGEAKNRAGTIRWLIREAAHKAGITE